MYTCLFHLHSIVYLSGEDPRFYKRGIGQYPARLSGGFQSPTEINAGGSQPRKVEGASHHARRGKNAEAFLNSVGKPPLHIFLSSSTISSRDLVAIYSYPSAISSGEIFIPVRIHSTTTNVIAFA